MSRAGKRIITWLAAAGAIAGVTAAGVLAGLNSNTVGFVYLIAILLISLWGGVVVATAASIAATLCYNFFFFAPLYTLTIEQPANWFALAAFLVASVTVSRLVVAARVQTETAEQRTRELQTLYGLSIDLFSAARGGGTANAAAHAMTLFGAREGSLITDCASINSDPPARNAAASGQSVETPESQRRRDVYVPVTIAGGAAGVLVARDTEASMHALESAARLIGLAVERERFLEETAHVNALRESDALKTSLLRAISHDLTTPITAITIRIESLRRQSRFDASALDDLSAIGEETARLRRRIENLLSMARLEAGKATPRREPTPPADLFRAVRENLQLVTSARPLNVRVAADCPDANVDPSLALEIVVNLVENAHRASPPGAAIDVVAAKHASDPARIVIDVLDRGPGVPPDDATDTAQVGLGLAIARGLTAANGGSLALMPREGGGTDARVEFPAALLPVAEHA